MKPALFERISLNPKHKYDKLEEIYSSVEYEIGCIIDKQSILGEENSIYSAFPRDIHDTSHMQQMAIKIREAVLKYEPRLLNPRIKIQNLRDTSMEILIAGNIEFEHKKYAVMFQTSKHTM